MKKLTSPKRISLKHSRINGLLQAAGIKGLQNSCPAARGQHVLPQGPSTQAKSPEHSLQRDVLSPNGLGEACFPSAQNPMILLPISLGPSLSSGFLPPVVSQFYPIIYQFLMFDSGHLEWSVWVHIRIRCCQRR
jgi:hypothetical protein